MIEAPLTRLRTCLRGQTPRPGLWRSEGSRERVCLCEEGEFALNEYIWSLHQHLAVVYLALQKDARWAMWYIGTSPIRNRPSPLDHHRAPGIALLQNSKGRHFLMRNVEFGWISGWYNHVTPLTMFVYETYPYKH